MRLLSFPEADIPNELLRQRLALHEQAWPAEQQFHNTRIELYPDDIDKLW